MKLRNKKTGEIVEYDIIEAGLKVNPVGGYIAADSLTEFCDEWEDYEEPKEFWYITVLNGVVFTKYMEEPFTGEEEKKYKEIGNYFETKEEAEKAIEKLKAWKRLKDNSFRFVDLRFEYDELGGTIKFKTNLYDGINDDLDLLFGGEE